MRPGTLLRWYALKGILASEIEDGATLLDIGGFDGYASRNLMELFPDLKITVVDLDFAGLQSAREQGLSALCASATGLPIGDNRVDIVLCLDLIEHIDEDSKVVREISRVLKKNGKVVLTTPMEHGVSFPFMSRKREEEINKGWGHLRLGYSLEQIRKIFQDNNLAIEKTTGYFNFFSRLAYRFTILSKPSPWKGFVFKNMLRLEPFVKYGTDVHIIVGKKLLG